LRKVLEPRHFRKQTTNKTKENKNKNKKNKKTKTKPLSPEHMQSRSRIIRSSRPAWAT
jgi:hypothetical protein